MSNPSVVEKEEIAYQDWIRNNEPSDNELILQRQESKDWINPPLISVILPAYNTPILLLTEAIESVRNQTYGHWELCIANGSSENQAIRNLLEDYAVNEPRIKIKHLTANKGIAINTNEGIYMSSGDYVSFLDHDDLLAPFALFSVAKTILDNPDCDLLFSDEDKITENGENRFFPFFKPAFSPDYLRTNNYICHFLVIRRSLGENIAWFQSGFEGAQDYEFILRASEKASQIIHIPQILYHWRAIPGSTAQTTDAKQYASDSGLKAVKEHIQRIQLKAEAVPGPVPNTYRIFHDLFKKPKISIIIPNQNHAEDLHKCIDSIFEKTSYHNFELIIVENHSNEDSIFRLYDELNKYNCVKIIRYEKAFNFSDINNFAVESANGDVVLFLNNDTEVINEDWLERMLEFAIRPEIGIVGAKLYYPNDTIQHAGVIIGHGGIAGHAALGFERSCFGTGLIFQVPHNISAVTGACMMMRRSVFNQIGRWNPHFVLAFGDIDLCLKCKKAGYLNIWTPYAELYHHESKTRGYEDNPEKFRRFLSEIQYFKKCWAQELVQGDEYYNPNLLLYGQSYVVDPNSVYTEPRNIILKFKS